MLRSWGVVHTDDGAVRPHQPRGYLLLAAGNLTGTCGEALTTRGVPSGEAWLFSVSISRMNFSASMGVASLVSSGRRAITTPDGAIRGPLCLPAAKGVNGRQAITA